jgi:amidase
MDIAFGSAKRLSAMLRKRELGSLELLDHYIDRIERFDGALNAVVVRDFERARTRAKALDRKRQSVGKLHGLPITVKESFQVAGLPTTWGLPAQQDNIAQQNALAVQRLIDAGAVVFGKTNIPALLADWQSFNPVYGTTNNPWDATRSPGGSSGGAAAALAAGLTGMEFGSDIGGSIRQPAHACGVFGHKPTWGLMPPYGHALGSNAAMTDISVIGPLARSAEDLGVGLELLGTPDPAETELELLLPKPPTKSLHGLRVAIWPEQEGQATDPAITSSLHDLARALRAEGSKISLVARPELDPVRAYQLFLNLESAALSGRASEVARQAMQDAAARLAPDDMSTDSILLRAALMPHWIWLGLNEQRHVLRRAWGEFFKSWDVLICPAFGTPAYPHMQDGETWERRITVAGREIAYNDLLFWPGVIGGFHLPSTAVPLGETEDGLPYGMQIVGPLYGDRQTIAVAGLLERAWRRFVPPTL